MQGGLPVRMKTPPQPLVFCYNGPTALCAAVAELYRLEPKVPSALCVWRGKYYLRVEARLNRRKCVAETGGQYGVCLGPCPVLYAFCQEHGEEITQNAVAQLGGALTRRRGGGAPAV